MIKSSIFVIVAIAATSVFAAAVPEVMPREDGSELVARNPDVESDSVFLREDSGDLEEREPFFAPILGGVARFAAKRIVKHKVNKHRNNRRKRDLEDEDMFEREDGSELVARNPDVESDSVFLREDSGELEEREPFFPLILGGVARFAATRFAKHKINKHRKRDLEDEDMFERDLAVEDLSEREWEDLMERELAEEMLEREVGVEDDLD